MSKKKYLCPCCKKYVFADGPGSFEICPVCSWEDDRVQAENPDYKGGANKMSLNECIKKFNSVLALLLTFAMFIAGFAGLSGCGTASDADNYNTQAESSVVVSAESNSVQKKSSEVTEAKTYSFRNPKLLNSHYEKHGKDMGFSSAKEYEKAAAAVVNNPAALHKTEAEDGDDVYYVESTNEFVIVSTDGYLSLIHI